MIYKKRVKCKHTETHKTPIGIVCDRCGEIVNKGDKKENDL